MAASLVSVAGFVGTDTAQAGTATIFSCKAPDGTPADTDGWTVGTSGGHYITAIDRCPGEGLILDMWGAWNHAFAQQATATFQAPANTRIKRVEGHRTIVTGVGTPNAWPEYLFTIGSEHVALHGANVSIGDPNQALSGANKFPPIATNAEHLTFTVHCVGHGQPCATSPVPLARAVITQMTIDLEHNDSPVVEWARGDLFTKKRPLSAVESMKFRATSRGLGIFRLHLYKKDGAQLTHIDTTQAIDSNDGKCVPIQLQAQEGQAPHHAWRNLKPCKPTVESTYEIDTNRIGDGQHTLILKVEDATGNMSVVDSGKVTVKNRPDPPPPPPAASPSSVSGSGLFSPHVHINLPGTPNGVNSCPSAHVVGGFRGRLPLRLGQGVDFSGRLVCLSNGLPIQGATLVVSSHNERGPARASTRTVRTDASGAFVTRFGAGPSRAVRVDYLMSHGDPRALASLSTVLRVQPKVNMRMNVRRVRRGKRRVPQELTWSGRVMGGHIPAGGVPLKVQWRSKSGWKTFTEFRTNSNGKFRHAYPIRQARPWQFRIVVPGDVADYPFTNGQSQVVKLNVRGR